MAERGYASVTISEVLDGYNQATVMLYARGAAAPALPSSAVTYTFETGALSSVPANWSRSVPTANGFPCWVIIAWPVGRDSTCSIATTDWSSATKLVEDGDDAYTVILTNESHTFVGDTTKAVAGSTTIGVQAFKGSTQVAATIGTITGQVTGLTTSISNNNSLTASVTVTVTTSLTTQGGTLTIPITVDAVTVNKIFSWTLKLNGKDGTRGATWYSGTGITGTSTTPTVFSGSGVSSALVGDHYLNTSTQNIYVCTTAGSASAAKWKYEENIKGATGKGITSITPMYYLSTANDSQTGGSWETTPPVYQVGRYYWTKQSIMWTDGTTTDTTPTLDNGLNAANSSAEYARLQAEPSLAMKINYSAYSTADSGEVYLHGYTNKLPADVNGYIMWNGVERTVSKGMINPNAIVPYNRYIYIVLRLTSASSTSGTLYMVWYNSGWKYAVTPTPTAVGGTWTWDEAKDVVLGQFIEPGSEQDLVEAYLYNPPRTAAQVKTTNPSPYQYSQSAVEWYNSNGQTTVNANTMLAAWADGAFSATTEIDGGFIKAHTIQAEHLATDAIMSNNFQASSVEGSPFSAAGTFLDLTTGNLYSPNFGIDNSYGVAYLNGEIIATSGRIGNSGASNYWEIGTKVDYNQAQSAAIIGHGTSYIQSGEWQLSNNRLDSRSYNAQNQITYPYANSTYYDFGINMPTLDTTLNHESYPNGVDNLGHNDNFIYIRTAENSIPQLETNWNYVFRIDKSGMIWINGQSLDQRYALATGVDGTYLPLTGGVITGNLTVNGTLTAIASQATKLANARTFITNLASTSTGSFDGQANVSLGVTGTLGVGNGGTGRNTLTSGSALIGNGTSAVNFRAITNNTSATYITANDNLITANTLKFWNGSYDSSNNSNIEYVKLGKLGTAATHAVEDFITVGGGVIDGSLSVTDLTAGSLVVNGAARFVNGAIGDLTGNASTADQVNTKLKIQLNGGTTEGTNQFTFDGSAAKTVNITKSSIGLGNVENKGVDTSISAGSTSANLPTSAAVATFVESKGYVTSSGVISVGGTSPVSVSGTTSVTISLADNYGDTKNPYAGNKAKNLVLATPSNQTGAPTFRALVADDIPSLTLSKISDATDLAAIEALTGTSGFLKKTAANTWSLDTNAYVKGLASGTTANRLVAWGSDGYTVADSGISKGSVATKLTLAGSDYSVSSNTITVTKANLQSAVQDTSYVLMTSEERSKLSSIAVSSGGTIDFSGVTASAPLTATVATNKTVNLTHNTSGVTNGTYRSVTVDTYGHVTGGTNPTTLSGYGITDAKIASGVITLGSNTITPLTSSSTLNAAKLSGTASVSTTGNAGTATKFSSVRSITLTGDTTGTASADGSSGWSIATKTDRLTTVGDNRSVVTIPNDYANKLIFQGLKNNSVIGKATVTNKDPYFLRPSASIGDREFDTLVGGTLGWNQLINPSNYYNSLNGVTPVVDGARITAQGTLTSGSNFYLILPSSHTKAVSGHKYAVFGLTKTVGMGVNFSSPNTTVTVLQIEDTSTAKMFVAVESGDMQLQLNRGLNFPADIDVDVTPTLIDLTTLFGATIADYIYSLEQATAGAGVAWVRRYLTAEYYPFCAPTLKHVEGVSAHVLTGFNLINFELYRMLVSSMSTLDVSKAVRVMSGCKYEINFESIENATNWRFGLYCFDFEGNRLLNGVLANGGDLSFNGSANYYVNGANITEKRSTFTPLFNGYVMPFVCSGDTSDSTVIHKGCLHLYWDGERDGEYEPYVQHSYPLDDSLTLRGVPKLDSNNKLYYDGDIYSADGTVTRKYGIVDLGTLEWSLFSANEHIFTANYPYVVPSTANLITAKYAVNTYSVGTNRTDKTINAAAYFSATGAISIKDTDYSTAADLKTSLSGVYLVYEKSTPTTAEAEPFASPQICDPDGTEEYVTSGLVPVGHETFYRDPINNSNSTYSYVLGLRGWGDNSGGNAHELAFNNGGIYRRTGATTTWDSWHELLDSENYPNYTVTRSGEGAYGKWNIDISGVANSANTATKWSSAQKVYVTLNIASTTTTIQGGNSSAQTIGVNGTLGVANGGTGKTTGKDAANYFLNSLDTGSSTPVDGDYYISQYVSGGTTTTTYHRRPMSALWSYINTKAESVYAKLSGATFTGAVAGTSFTGTSFGASGHLACNTGNSNTAGGIALYATNPTTYGIAMRGTSNSGKHGYVQGDWATYNYMSANANVVNRGWVWNYSNSAMHSVASLSGEGHMVLNGSMTVGGNSANTSGCRLVMDNTLKCLNFVFA